MKIGLEIHPQLSTAEKLFSSIDFIADVDVEGLQSNSCDLLDWACPGVLPVLNMEAVGQAIKAGLLFKAQIADRLQFDRKHYRYHDMPLGYQITQRRTPIAVNGILKFA